MPQPLETTRHSLAHLMATAVLKLFGPEVQFGIGPVIEHGFYYDFQLSKKLTEKDFELIEQTMKELISENHAFIKTEIPLTKAIEIFSNNNQPFKVELLQDLATKKTTEINPEENFSHKNVDQVSIYQSADFSDLCRGPHVNNSQEIPPYFKIQSVAGAYWRGDSKNPMMQRLYAVSFNTEAELKEHLNNLELASQRDHRKLGTQLDLFCFSDQVGPGLPLWTPKGTILREILDNYVWQLRQTAGYQKVEIPHITKKKLYQTSGHWDKFADQLFIINSREKHQFALKPMNCPFHTQIFDRKPRSYRELPQRYSNTTTVYRDEQTGELNGLTRVRSITQDDAHVFCRTDQIETEIQTIWKIINQFYQKFNFELKVRLSLHDPKKPNEYLGDLETWQETENVMRKIANQQTKNLAEAVGEASFYGPKLDFIALDSLKREWQVATIQLDFNMPNRFKLKYTDNQGQPQPVIMIHAAIMGSLERFIGILIEHTAGKLPTWLSPVQATILPVKKTDQSTALELQTKLQQLGARPEVITAHKSLGYRIRQATTQKTPYILIIGKEETNNQTIQIRQNNTTKTLPLTEFIAKFKTELQP